MHTHAPIKAEEMSTSHEAQPRDKAPCAADIERWLRSGRVLTLRPMVWAGVGVLSLVRRFSWSAHFECDLMRLKGPWEGWAKTAIMRCPAGRPQTCRPAVR